MRFAVICFVYVLAQFAASHAAAQTTVDLPNRGTVASDLKVAGVAMADEERLAAMRSADRAKLDAILSDELRYAHSNGVVDTKASLTDTLLSGKTKYLSFDYQERKFTTPAPGIALMSGRVRVQVESAGGKMDAVLSYLAVWRQENGKWRFLAWQSCKVPPSNNP
ncbi:MAG: nuclear transport factor 2 family protein [Aureliella sp.]